MEITTYLNKNFESITLSEMDNVKLMNRTDTKFAFSVNYLPEILSRMRNFYKVLEIDNERVHSYRSLYYDTDDRKFYLDHHNQRVNRNKVRFREYVGSKLTYLEIKHKNNKGKTIKKRTKVNNIPKVLNQREQEYIKKIIGSPLQLSAKQWINFSRITFVHKKQKERMTMDIDLTYMNEVESGDLKNIIIAEVKQERASRSSDFMRIAKEMSILPMRISKYCISALSLNPKLKSNRFKEKLLFINKLKQA